MALVELQNLAKVYDIPAFPRARQALGIGSLSFSVEEGEIFGLLGLNGNGKTTTLRLLLGLLRPTSGVLKVFGESPWQNAEIRAQMGYLPERLLLPKTLRALELLDFLTRLDTSKFLGPAARRKRMNEALAIVGLKEVSERYIGTFSKGMIQRLGIAQAIVSHPKLLILDEPASGLDPLGIIQMRELFLKLNKEMGLTILFSSHSISEVERVSHRVGILSHQRLKKIINREDWQASGPGSLEDWFLECVQES